MVEQNALRGNRTPGGSMATTQVTTTPLMRQGGTRTVFIQVIPPSADTGEGRGRHARHRTIQLVTTRRILHLGIPLQVHRRPSRRAAGKVSP